MKFDTQIKALNESLPGNSAGKYYGIPTEMMDTSPTSFTQERIYSLPQFRWDLYNKIGAPEIKDLDGLIDAFVQLKFSSMKKVIQLILFHSGQTGMVETV